MEARHTVNKCICHYFSYCRYSLKINNHNLPLFFSFRMSEFQKELLKRIISINQFSTVRPSIKETCDNLCSIICSRIKRKESGNILLIGSPGSGKSFIIKKAIGMQRKIIFIK